MGRALMMVVGGCLVFALVLGGLCGRPDEWGSDERHAHIARRGTRERTRGPASLGGPRPERGLRPAPVWHGRSWRPSVGWRATAAGRVNGCLGRCQCGRRRGPDAVRAPDFRGICGRRSRWRVPSQPPMTQSTPSTARPGCCAPTEPVERPPWPRAIGDYNHSLSYVETVVVLAQALAADPGMPADAASALAYAAAQLGTPYRSGWDRPRGFRLLGSDPGRVPSRGHRAAPCGPGPVRCRARGFRRCLGTAGGPALLWDIGPRRRTRGPLCRGGRDDRRAPQRCASPGGAGELA